MPKGSLTVVGSGIKSISHLTQEAQLHIAQAEKVLYGLADTFAILSVEDLNSTAEALPYYFEGKSRIETYHHWVEIIAANVRAGTKLCVVFYGHPGVFVYASHEAIKLLRSEGFEATMLPGISAEDCLIADLGFDPARGGCQSFEATDFLVHHRKFDPTSHLILWQIWSIGENRYNPAAHSAVGLEILKEELLRTYDKNHEVIVYEASKYPISDAVIQRLPLEKLCDATISTISTLYVPPYGSSPMDKDILERLVFRHS